MSKLGDLDRDDLNTVAAALGVAGAEKLPNKDEVVKAILDTAAPQDEKLTARIEELEAELRGREPDRETREIVRKTTVGATPGYEDKVRTWWCPFDDHANGGEIDRCGGCGAVRDEDTGAATRETYGG